MCIYCTTKKYRKIYENHHGSIPVDNDNRTHEIHHIDGNHNNNEPNNLKAVTIEEHYNIHHQRGDLAACLIMSKRMKITPTEKSDIASKLAKQRILSGEWHFTSEFAKNNSRILMEQGRHYWQTEEHKKNMQNIQNQKVKDGTHNLLGTNNPVYARVKNGTWHTLGPAHNLRLLASGKHASQNFSVCPHCGSTMDNANYAKHHGNNCHLVKEKKRPSDDPNYINSRAKTWIVTNTLTGTTDSVVGLKTWARNNGFNSNTVDWSVRKHRKYKHFLITAL